MTALPARILPSDSLLGASPAGAFLAALFTAYAREGIRYAVLRNYWLWPHDFGKDVDLVVHRDDLDRHDVLLSALCREHGLVVLERARRRDHRMQHLLSLRAGASVAILSLDVHGRLGRLSFAYLPVRVVLAGQRVHGPFRVPSPAAEALALLLHCVFDKARVRASYGARVRALTAEDPAAFRALAERELGAGWGERLLGAAATPEAWLRLRTALRVAILRRRPAALVGSLAARAAAQLRRVRAFLRPPGVLAVLVGPDGAGKSTLAERACRRLAGSPLGATSVYLGAQRPLLPTRRWTQALRRRVRPPGAPRPVKDVGRRLRLRGLVHILADKWLRYLVHVRPRLVRGHAVVLDRYFYDLLTFPHPFIARPWVHALLLRLAPMPTLAFSLAADPAVIAARKRELTTAETARQLACFRGLRRWVRDFHELSADGDLDANVERVVTEVVRAGATRSPRGGYER